MNWVRLLRPVELSAIVVLIFAHALIHALEFYFGWHPRLPIVRDALPFSQFALLLIWLFVGPPQWRVRGLLVLCWMLFAGLTVWRPYLVSMPTMPNPVTIPTMKSGIVPRTFETTVMWGSISSTEFRMVVAQCVAVALALGVVRMKVFSLRRDEGTNGREMQFSLRTLMLLTAFSGVAMGLTQWLRSRFDTSVIVPEMLGIGSLSAAFAAVSLLAVWATFGKASVLLRLAIFGTATLVLGALPPYVCHRESDLSSMMTWVNTHGVLVVSSLLVVRDCGYRLVRAPRRALPLTA